MRCPTEFCQNRPVFKELCLDRIPATQILSSEEFDFGVLFSYFFCHRGVNGSEASKFSLGFWSKKIDKRLGNFSSAASTLQQQQDCRWKY